MKVQHLSIAVFLLCVVSLWKHTMCKHMLIIWLHGQKVKNNDISIPERNCFSLDMMRMCSVLICDELEHPKWFKYKHESCGMWVVMAKHWGKSKIKLKWLNWVKPLQLELESHARPTGRHFLIKPVESYMYCLATSLPHNQSWRLKPLILNWWAHISAQSYSMY